MRVHELADYHQGPYLRMSPDGVAGAVLAWSSACVMLAPLFQSWTPAAFLVGNFLIIVGAANAELQSRISESRRFENEDRDGLADWIDDVAGPALEPRSYD